MRLRLLTRPAATLINVALPPDALNFHVENLLACAKTILTFAHSGNTAGEVPVTSGPASDFTQ